MEHIIYGLYDPSDLSRTIRYVGYTSNIHRRLIVHLTTAKRRRSNHLHHWLNNVVRRGLRPGIVVIETVTKETWQDRERFWISQFSNLVNSTIGGEGLINPTQDVRDRISKKVSVGLIGNSRRTGIPHDKVGRDNISLGLKSSDKFKEAHARRRGRPGHKTSEETKDKIRQKKLGVPHPQTPEWTANIAAGHLGLKQSRETIEKRAKKMIGNQNALGFVHTEIARDAIREKRTGTRLITNGTIRKFLWARDPLPDGWNFVVTSKKQEN